MERLADTLKTSPALLSLAVVVVLFATRAALRKSAVPNTLPWVGKPSGILAETRASFASFLNARQWLAEGYAKVPRNSISDAPLLY